MKTDKIEISQFDFLTITSLEIDREVGDHACTKVSGYISDEDVEDYKWRLLEDIWITITSFDEDGGRKIIMTGIVAGFSLEQQPHSSFLSLEIMGGTSLMDRVPHFRSFQTMDMTYQDVMKWINGTYQDADMIGMECLKMTPCNFLFQYQETDWAFIKRIASHFGLMVTPSIVREGELYHVGDVYCVAYELSSDMKYSVKKQENNSLEYSISVKEVYDLWNLITFGRNGGYVYKIHSEYKHGEMIHTYYLCGLEQMKTASLYNEAQSGCSFPAVVKAVQRDQVQVTLLEDENSSQEITKWFPYATGYSSPDGPAWYCMPEVGDTVRLQMPDRREEHAYAVSAVHMETGTDRKNPEHKSFKTRYGKELLFTPSTIEMTNNQGTSIKIIDGEGIRIVSSKDISITSGGNMTLSSENASLMIAGSGTVDVRQGSAGLHLDKDVVFTGGKFRIQ